MHRFSRILLISALGMLAACASAPQSAKVDPATAETDAGWVYATVAPTGEVTSSGRVASCMGCHEASATHERLYGVPLSPSF